MSVPVSGMEGLFSSGIGAGGLGGYSNNFFYARTDTHVSATLVPWVHPTKTILPIGGVDSIFFFGATANKTSGANHYGLYYIPLSGDDKHKVFPVEGFELPHGARSRMPMFIDVMHNGTKKALFAVDDQHGELNNGSDTAIRRGIAIWLTDGVGVDQPLDSGLPGTYRVGSIKHGDNRSVFATFDESAQVGSNVYLKGGEDDTTGGLSSDGRKTRFYVVDLNQAALPPRTSTDGGAGGGVSRIMGSDPGFVVAFKDYVYYRKNGNLQRTNDDSTGEVAFDTGTDGTISHLARPYIQDDILYFVARTGDATGGAWKLYTYDGTDPPMPTEVVTLGTGAVSPASLGPGTLPGTLSLVTKSRLYVVDRVPPTLAGGATEAVVTAGATNALARFAPSEDAHYFWLVSTNATSPTLSALRSGRVGDSPAIAHNVLGDQSAPSGRSEDFEIVGLSSDTAYYLHLMLVDGAGNASSAIRTSFTTTSSVSGDADASTIAFPALSAPLRVSTLATLEATLTYTPNKDCTAYWIFVPFASSLPTAAQVEGGTDASDAAALATASGVSVSSTEQTLELMSEGSLTIEADTNYQLHLILKDDDGNYSDVYSAHFTTNPTRGNPPNPVADSGIEITDLSVVSNASDNTKAAVSFSVNEEAYYYWVVQESSLPFPVRGQVEAGEDANGMATPAGQSGADDSSTDSVSTGSFEVTDLTSLTAYTVYILCEERSAYTPIQSLTFVAGAPFLTLSAPVDVDDAAGTATVSFTTSTAGDYYWVVQGASLPPPSGAQLQGGLNANGLSGGVGFFDSSGTATDPNGTNTFTVRNLVFSGTYAVHVVIEDGSGVLLPAASATFTYTRTGGGVVGPRAPDFATAPVVTPSFDTATVSFTSDAAGKYYWVVQPASVGTDPDADKVKMGQDGDGNDAGAGFKGPSGGADMSANVAVSLRVQNLSQSTTYQLFMVLTNVDGDAERVAESVSFRTLLVPITVSAVPILLSGPDIEEPSSSTGRFRLSNVTFTADANGEYHWVVQEASAGGDPTAEQVKAGQDWEGNSVRSEWKRSSPLDANMEKVSQANSLWPGDDYVLFLVLEGADALGTVRRQPFTQGTAVVAAVAPRFTTDPSVTAGLDTAEATFTAGADGKYYWVVQAASVGMAPAADAVKAGQDGDGNAADADHKGEGAMTADTAVPFQIGDLGPDTSYRLFVVLTDATDAATSAVKAADFTTEADPSAPVAPRFTTDPSVTAGMDTAEATFTAGADGKYYWVVQAASVTAPDADAVKAGQDGDGNAADADHKGEGTMTADTAEPIQIGDLGLDTTYRLFVVLTDATDAATSAVEAADFTTEADPSAPVAPKFTEDPTVTAGLDTAEATFTAGADGKYYWVVQAASVTAPDADAVKAGQDGEGNGVGTDHKGEGEMMADTAVPIQIGSLEPDTSYQLFVLLTDTAGDAERAVKAADFTTEAEPVAAAPIFVSGPDVTQDTNDDTAANISFTSDAAGTYHWVVQDASVTTDPNADAVKAGQDGDGNAAGTGRKGDGEMGAETAVSFPVGSLTQGADYVLFMVLDGDALGAVRRQEFTHGTAVVAPVAPEFTTDPTVTAGMDTAEATFTAGADGKYYWVVQESSVAAPAADEVKAGQDGEGNAADADHKGEGEMMADMAVPIQIGNLEPDTSYQLFVLLTDATDAATSAVKAEDFTTKAEPSVGDAPDFEEAPEVSASDSDAEEAVVSFEADADGDYYWIVQEASVRNAPNAEQVKAGEDGNGDDPIDAGDGEMEADEAEDFVVEALEMGTEYHLYMVLEADGVTGEVLEVAFTHAAGPSLSTAYSGIEVTPNPVSDTLFVRTPTRAMASLYTLSGERLGRYQLQAGHNSLSLASHRAGVYVLRVVSGGDVQLHRILKK